MVTLARNGVVFLYKPNRFPIDRLAYFARELASFASYTLALFGQNEIVAGS
jgi:hypothetical protein